jgi:hypothetical protein
MLAQAGDPSFFEDVLQAAQRAKQARTFVKEEEMSHQVALGIHNLIKEGDKPGELGHLPQNTKSPDKLPADRKVLRSVRSLPDGTKTKKIRLIDWDIVDAVARFRPDPETLMSSSGFRRIRQELKTHGLISAYGVEQTRVTVKRLVRKQETGNLETESYRGIAYHIPEVVLNKFLEGELRGKDPDSKSKEPAAHR